MNRSQLTTGAATSRASFAHAVPGSRSSSRTLVANASSERGLRFAPLSSVAEPDWPGSGSGFLLVAVCRDSRGSVRADPGWRWVVTPRPKLASAPHSERRSLVAVAILRLRRPSACGWAAISPITNVIFECDKSAISRLNSRFDYMHSFRDLIRTGKSRVWHAHSTAALRSRRDVNAEHEVRTADAAM